MDRVAGQAISRRDELLELAAAMFAERGLRATTVRDIADGAGILSGSLYHHFSPRRRWSTSCCAVPRLAVQSLPRNRGHRAQSAGTAPRGCSWRRSRQSSIGTPKSSSTRTKRSDCRRSPGSPISRTATSSNARCGWRCSSKASRRLLPPDLDVDLVYRFIRDTTWVSVRWYQPGGPLTAEQVGLNYLAIVLGGITREGV
ncbi:HTH-type transcriptional repressor KstR2 [Mycobacterium kansasii]|uniref:HTH-type transcriptional repressor KstR2 n=1 Tax=Mycobacterium kansasii TaxID=1768 RepID=A0A1V3W8J3_MYCKA|nr:HTH-type transcriptional repressor KstR2 [Mycobacterium kansasii]